MVYVSSDNLSGAISLVCGTLCIRWSKIWDCVELANRTKITWNRLSPMNQHLQKVRAQEVRAMASKVIALHEEYGVTIPQLAQRFGVSVFVIKEIVKKVK